MYTAVWICAFERSTSALLCVALFNAQAVFCGRRLARACFFSSSLKIPATPNADLLWQHMHNRFQFPAR